MENNSIRNQYTLDLDIKSKYSGSVPRFYQFDYAELRLYVSDGGKPFDLSRFDRVSMFHRKPGGEIFKTDAELVIRSGEESYIRYVYSGEEMETGTTDVSVVMYFKDKKISIQSFSVRILPRN